MLATTVRQLGTTCMRNGNETYARTGRSFARTTLKNRHVTVAGRLLLEFLVRG